jgi:citronellol/citronellal dehydrogenase
MIARMSDTARSEVFLPKLLEGKVALVTGGGTGLGKATAIELARCGARVVIAGRRAEVLEGAVAEMRGAIGADDDEVARMDAVQRLKTVAGADVAQGAEIVAGEDLAAREDRTGWIAGDVREPTEARRLITTVLERRGRLDMLVNNAGGQYFTPAEGIVAKGWRAVWRLNVEGMLNMAQAAAAHGMGAGRTGEGTIVNVTLSPHHGMPGMAHSGAARATVEALTRELAVRWADRRIAVTAVAAGHFDTEAMGKYPDSVRAGMGRSVPLGRLGHPQEHAWLVALLCSPLGWALNGSTITLDGARDNWFGPWPPPGLTDAGGEVPTEARR